MRARQGITLIGTLWLIALLGSLLLSALGIFLTVQGRLSGHKQSQQAAAMAISGRDYASAMIKSGRWKGPAQLKSPTFPGGESFEVEVKRSGSAFKIISIGHAGAAYYKMEGAP